MTTTMISDGDLRSKVLAELRWDPRVQDRHIGVHVDDGAVTLTGAVYAYGTRLAAQEAAHRVEGVRDVANDIKVDVQPGRGTDTELAQAVRRMLEWDERVPDTRITSTVSNGWVTLDGTVDTWSEREDAEHVIANLSGVQSVTNNICIAKHPAKSDDLRHVIEAVLTRRAERHAKRINVEVSDGVVTLSGPVDSLAERRALVASARLTPGVHAVNDRLSVESYVWVATPAS